MADKIINGKVALSTKPETSTDLSWDENSTGYGDFFKIDPALKKELDAKGYGFKFIRAKKFVDDGGFHKQEYKPYKRDKVTQKDGSAFEFGLDPEGYTRRGDLILAVKPKAMIAKAKAIIQARTDSYSNIKQQNEADKESISKTLRDAGGNVKITAGSDEDSDS